MSSLKESIELGVSPSPTMIPGLTLKTQDGRETWETWGPWVSWEQEQFLSLCLPCQRKLNTDYLLCQAWQMGGSMPKRTCFGRGGEMEAGSKLQL